MSSKRRLLASAAVGVAALAGSLALAAPASATPNVDFFCDPGYGLASCTVQWYGPPPTAIHWTINNTARPDLDGRNDIGDPCVLGTVVKVQVAVSDATGTVHDVAFVKCQLFVP